MKRIGDPSEKPFEKVPRRQERGGDEEEAIREEVEEIQLDLEGYPGFGISGEGRDDDCETTESAEDLFTYELLLKSRTTTNPFGVFCLFALKEIGLDLDVISLVIPSVHMHSLWSLELEQLGRLQTKRLQRMMNCKMDGIIVVEQEELKEIEEEASSIHLMSFLLGDFGFNCEYTQRFWPFLVKYFEPDSPFVHTIYNAVGWSLAQIFIKARHACKKEEERKRMQLLFVHKILKAMPATLKSIMKMSVMNGSDTFFLYLIADVIESLLSFCVQLRGTSVLEEKQIFELLAAPDCFNFVLGMFFPEYTEYIAENPSKTDIAQLLHCVSTMAQFFGPIWMSNYLDLLSFYCDVAFAGLLEKCERGEGISCELVHGLARGFKFVLPHYIKLGNRELVDDLVQFVLIVLPHDEFDEASEVMRLEKEHPELCLLDFDGRLLYVSEYLPLQPDLEYKEVLQKWVLPSSEEIVSAKQLECNAKLAKSIATFLELTSENQELARERRDCRKKGQF